MRLFLSAPKRGCHTSASFVALSGEPPRAPSAQVDLPTPPPHALTLGLSGNEPAPLLLPDTSGLFALPAPRSTAPPSGGPPMGHPSQPALKRTRSGSRLVPADAAGPSNFSVDVANVPPLQRVSSACMAALQGRPA